MHPVVANREHVRKHGEQSRLRHLLLEDRSEQGDHKGTNEIEEDLQELGWPLLV
jgi:hypothetical protein